LTQAAAHCARSGYAVAVRLRARSPGEFTSRLYRRRRRPKYGLAAPG